MKGEPVIHKVGVIIFAQSATYDYKIEKSFRPYFHLSSKLTIMTIRGQRKNSERKFAPLEAEVRRKINIMCAILLLMSIQIIYYTILIYDSLFLMDDITNPPLSLHGAAGITVLGETGHILQTPFFSGPFPTVNGTKEGGGGQHGSHGGTQGRVCDWMTPMTAFSHHLSENGKQVDKTAFLVICLTIMLC